MTVKKMGKDTHPLLVIEQEVMRLCFQKNVNITHILFAMGGKHDIRKSAMSLTACWSMHKM